MINVIFLVVLVLFIGVVFASGRELKPVFSLLFFVLIVFISGLRGDVGSDTYSYGRIYLDSVELFFEGVENFFFAYEPLFLGFSALHKLIFDDVTLYFLSVSALHGFLLWFSTRRLRHRWVFLSFYVVCFYLDFHFNVLRVSTAFLLFVSAMAAKSKALSFFLLLSSALTHVTVIALFPVYFSAFIVGKRYSWIYFILFLFGLSLVFLFFYDYIHSKLSAYDVVSASGVESGGFSVFRFVSFFALSLLSFYIFFKPVSSTIKVSFLLVIIFSFVMSFYPIFF